VQSTETAGVDIDIDGAIAPAYLPNGIAAAETVHADCTVALTLNVAVGVVANSVPVPGPNTATPKASV
jgi:hypothetical protein